MFPHTRAAQRTEPTDIQCALTLLACQLPGPAPSCSLLILGLLGRLARLELVEDHVAGPVRGLERVISLGELKNLVFHIMASVRCTGDPLIDAVVKLPRGSPILGSSGTIGRIAALTLSTELPIIFAKTLSLKRGSTACPPMMAES